MAKLSNVTNLSSIYCSSKKMSKLRIDCTFFSLAVTLTPRITIRAVVTFALQTSFMEDPRELSTPTESGR